MGDVDAEKTLGKCKIHVQDRTKSLNGERLKFDSGDGKYEDSDQFDPPEIALT